MTEQEFGLLLEHEIKAIALKQEQVYEEIEHELILGGEGLVEFIEEKILEGYVHFSKICNDLIDLFAKNFNDGKHQELYNLLMDSLTESDEVLASAKEELFKELAVA